MAPSLVVTKRMVWSMRREYAVIADTPQIGGQNGAEARMRTHRLLLLMFPVVGALAGQPETLTPEQAKLIEVHSCRLWHDRAVAEIRAEDTLEGGLRASVECMPHAEVRARRCTRSPCASRSKVPGPAIPRASNST